MTKMEHKSKNVKNTQLIIIGFSGKIGSGKDYIAKNIFLNLLKKKILGLNPLFLSFADPLKQECALKYGCSYAKLYQNKDNQTRELLQKVGSEFREEYGKEVYVNAMKMNIDLHSERSDINLIIIPDVRYPNEMKFIQDTGGKVYRITASKRTFHKLIKECNGIESDVLKRSTHVSETALDNGSFNGHISNDYNDDPEADCQLLVDHLISSF